MRKQIFEEYPIPKAILTLAIPTVLMQLVTVLYNLADTFFVGQMGDSNKVAAVSLCLPVFYLMLATSNLFGLGGGTYISRLLGRCEIDSVKPVASVSFYSCLIFGALSGILLLVFTRGILNLIGATPETYGYAKDYLTVIAIGAPAITLQNGMPQIVSAEGATKHSMIGIMIGAIANIVLDPLMILTFGWGVTGAAIATVIGNVLCVGYLMYYVLRTKDTSLSISPRHFKPTLEMYGTMLKTGFPAALHTALFCTGNALVNKFASIYSNNAVSAMGIAYRIEQVPKLLLIGISRGAQPFIGYNYAAGNHKRMNGAIKFAAILGIAFGTVCCAVILLFAEQFIGVFLNVPEVITIGARFLRTMIVTMPVIVLLFLSMHALQAFGKAKPALLLSICRDGITFIPAAILFQHLLGINGIACALPFSDVAATVIGLALYVMIYKRMKAEAPPDQIPRKNERKSGRAHAL